MVEDIQPLEIEHPITHETTRFWFEDPHVAKPVKEDSSHLEDPRLFPRECREGGTTYKGAFTINLCFQTGNNAVQRLLRRKMGSIPIMVASRGCYLRNLSRAELVKHKEESTEMGGYFICNGIERIVRCLILQRRHYIMGLRRGAYRNRGPKYTEYGTLIRCVRPDQSSATVRCHYLVDGTVNFAFVMRRAEFFIPAGVLLKCFLEVSDKELYDKLLAGAVGGGGHAEFVAERAEMLIREAGKLGLGTRARSLEYLGNHFRVILDVPPGMSDYDVGQKLLREYVFIHLEKPGDKLQLLLAMLNKLYALVNRQCHEDNPDALTHHEVLLPGHLMLKFVKECMQDFLEAMKTTLKSQLESTPEAVNLQDETYVKKLCEKWDLGRKLEYLLNTGNLTSKSGLDLSQTAGFTIVAEKLNFLRYLSHFRSIHRGAYFAELRTTTVRKLLPESWGFLCPVHTPDGSPCGLLNHFTAACQVVAEGPENPDEVEEKVMQVLTSLGMVPAQPALVTPSAPNYLLVMLDGKVVGHVSSKMVNTLVNRLRAIKAGLSAIEEEGMAPEDLSTEPPGGAEIMVPMNLEVAYIPYQRGGPFPGVFLFTQAARMMRPVRHLHSGGIELIGTLEQNNLHIHCPDGGAGGSPGLKFTHAELSAGQMLSVVASLTPYSDYNQSPRNMYQCQMGKQTMGTAVQALTHRTDNKLYRLQTPQTPLARTSAYDKFHMDEFPNGTNAVVAVLAYTGYDMEDAMILNKSSVERGLAHGSLYKTEMINLKEEKDGKSIFAPAPDRRAESSIPERMTGAFGQKFPQNAPSIKGSQAVKSLGLCPLQPHEHSDTVDADGLPHVGAIIWPDQSYYCTKDLTTGKHKAHKLKGEEVAVVDMVTVLSTKDKNLQKANIKLRYNRNPVIGDKFSSRHGQKGVLSIMWPDIDMPYAAATGIRPDIIINPHAFPSRMTIGMLVESMAAKAGALKGEFVEATPFQKCEGKTESPVEVFGSYLEKAGFARYGQETMISGITGQEMPCDIYLGVVYYQRLRHMVSDKFQVRSTGPINQLTHQPIKGRKFGGGIRFGEMERDSLLAHGAAYLLHDRLHACSDYHVLDVCTRCGSMLTPISTPQTVQGLSAPMLTSVDQTRGGFKVECRACAGSGKYIERVAMPYVFKYLVTELAAMNIKVTLGVK